MLVAVTVPHNSGNRCKYGSLDRKQKEKRRTQRLGNCGLIRYADDWLLYPNGGKAEALRLREEFQTFLKEELKLELNMEKTRVTHVNNGFDFLGFHVRRTLRVMINQSYWLHQQKMPRNA
ncbi:reverse transcriptase domain-containing protein [Microseira sp. BLCC-F43]|uniref:reverse transcriptase domain-containing protein n=1 Tax=Microseira sp. BLCC-F43 TaxID=3153602 RepID=UPI0035BAB342